MSRHTHTLPTVVQLPSTITNNRPFTKCQKLCSVFLNLSLIKFSQQFWEVLLSWSWENWAQRGLVTWSRAHNGNVERHRRRLFRSLHHFTAATVLGYSGFSKNKYGHTVVVFCSFTWVLSSCLGREWSPQRPGFLILGRIRNPFIKVHSSHNIRIVIHCFHKQE